MNYILWPYQMTINNFFPAFVQTVYPIKFNYCVFFVWILLTTNVFTIRKLLSFSWMQTTINYDVTCSIFLVLGHFQARHTGIGNLIGEVVHTDPKMSQFNWGIWHQILTPVLANCLNVAAENTCKVDGNIL